MEEEIKNTENTEETQVQSVVRSSRNIFRYDYPVGRLGFILNTFLILIIAVVFMFISKYIYIQFDTNDNLPILMSLLILIVLFIAYLGLINFAKRFYDLFGDKQKGLFYAAAFYIINTASSFIPVVRYLDIVFAAVVLLILVVKPGKLIR